MYTMVVKRKIQNKRDLQKTIPSLRENPTNQQNQLKALDIHYFISNKVIIYWKKY